MNMDGNKRLLPQGDYPFANNICKEATASGYDGTPNATPGNYLASSLTGDSSRVDTVIYAHADQYRKKVYYFIYNASGYHQIRVWDKDTNTITLLIEDKTNTNGVSVLNFSLTYPVTSCDIIHRETSEGDLMFFTDGYNPPRKVNINKLTSGYYGGVILDEYLTAAKTPPLNPPTVAYGNDNNRLTNNLRRRLYQLKYRWVYDDFEKSTWSPISDTPLPGNIVNNDNDLDPTFNNYIQVVLKTGNKEVVKIELAVRESIDGLWGDFVLVDELSKSYYSMVNNSEFTYNFYNDSLYPPIDVQESDLLFDYVPKKAKAQCLVNGNVVLYGAITEGYNQISKSDLNVSMTVDVKKNSGTDPGSAGTATLTWETTGTNQYKFTVGSYVSNGWKYKVYYSIAGTVNTYEYISTSLDTPNTIASALFAQVPIIYQHSSSLNTYTMQLPASSPPSYIAYVQVTVSTSYAEIFTNKTWNWYSKYRFGLVYFDEKGRTNGVCSYVNQVSGNNDFEINTPGFSHDTGTPKTPVINATINHLPPSWAVKYMWVRTPNLTYDRFIYYSTCDFIHDTVNNYYYFCLANIEYYYKKNTNFIYNSANVAEGDRIRVICSTVAGFGSTVYTQDYEILGLEEKTYPGSTDKVMYIKTKSALVAPSPAYVANMMVMLYTPKARSTSESDNVFYEFGQAYDIYNDGGVKRHRGQLQDQTSSQGATFYWETGDVYYHRRYMYNNISTASPTMANMMTIDVNFSEQFKSGLSGNGRPQIIDVNAKEQYYPTLVRFSQEYVADSNINGTNRFYYDNQDIYNRSYGDIVKLLEKDKTIRVFQQFKVGVVPVYQQIIKDAIGSDTVSVSDKLLNYIQYYQGDYGAGYHGTAIASNEFADYFVDAYRGVICRLGRDGITPLSSIYKVNNWATDNLTVRNSPTQKIVGCFDKKLQRYVMSFKAAYPYGEDTISFHEPSNSFESFHDFTPDFMVNLGSTFISFVGNGIWIHENETSYCNFYGVQYNPSISVVFNDLPDVKKTFTNVSVVTSGNAWYCTGVATPIGQFSAVPTSLFRKKEDVYHAPLLRDVYSTGSYISGNRLKGNYIEINFRPSSSSTFNNLTMSSVSFIESNKNNR